MWSRKHNIYYDMLNDLDNKTFPPRMSVSATYYPGKMRWTPSSVPFSLDLVEAVKRQIDFARKITALYPYDPVPEKLLLDSQLRYVKFMNLIRLNACSTPVPAMDIDLFWHTHQLSASNYLPWCTQHVGRIINHDDTIPGSGLSTGLDETVIAWGDNYFEDYLNLPQRNQISQQQPAIVQHEAPPGPTSGPPPPKVDRYPHGPPPPGTFPGPTTHDENPPPSLTAAQLRLWEFDVACQRKHEQRARPLEEAKARIPQIKYQLANMDISYLNQLAQPAQPAARPRSSLMGRVLHRTVRSNVPVFAPPTRRDRLQIELGEKINFVNNQRTFASDRQEWGRQRWPLLCAARGWGESFPTCGEWKRPYQGTTELPFPVYAATWYEDRALDYYNYLEGRGIEGGGMRVGGGMCGAVFDGGNCYGWVEPYVPPPVHDFVGSCGGAG